MLGFLQERFGIPQSVFANHHLLRRGQTVWLLTKDDRLAALASLRVESVGVPLLRRVKTHLKPTSAALQLYGKYSTENIVQLELVQLEELVENKEIKAEFPVSPGYVVISTKGVFIGCALYLPGRLVSQFPRHLFTSKTWNYLLPDKTD